MSRRKKTFTYYSLIAVGILSIISLDQLTKAWVVHYIGENQIGYSYFGGFLRLIHVRNLGMAFSLGNCWSDLARAVFFILFPLLFLFYLSYWLLKDVPGDKESTVRWINRLALILIIGGGMGNLIDRIFRHGVVDFIDVQFFGLFGLQRWPAFNIADSSVFLGAGCWLFLAFFPEGKDRGSTNEKSS